MTTDIQGPEETGSVAADPEAPWGRRRDGTPYKRDPSPFAHLRGRPFGSANGKGGKPPAPRTAAPAGKKRASLDGPLKLDAAGYGAKFSKWIRGGARALARKSPTPAAIVWMRSDEMGDAWGQVAVSHPKLGRFVDTFGKSSDLGVAITSTLHTAVLVAHSAGLTKGTWMAPYLDEAVMELLDSFMADPAARSSLGVQITVPDAVPADGAA